MFEAYGWVSIDESHVLPDLENELAKHTVPGLVDFRLIHDLNGVAALTVTACRNHRCDQPLTVFRYLAEKAPDAFGLLFIRDQESDHANEFRVWRLARGELAESADSLLSPCVPTIEPPYTGGE